MIPRRRIIPIFIPHYGCEHSCVFCNQHRIANVSVTKDYSSTLRSLNATLNSSLTTLCSQLAFYGGSFTALPVAVQDELLDAAQPFLDRNPDNSVRLSTRPDYIDSSIVDRLKKFGVATIEIGAQSMCDDVLLKSRRGHSATDVIRAAGAIKSSGLELIVQMMTGLPGDSVEKSVSTAKRLLALKPDGVRIYPTVVVKDTELSVMWQNGDYAEHTVEGAVVLCTELCAIFEEGGVPVIRIGLHANETLSAGDAVAGAYHPSLGELVYSRMYFNKTVPLLCGVPPGSDVKIAVEKGQVSSMIGYKRQNIEALKQKFSLRSLKIIEKQDNPRRYAPPPSKEGGL